MNSLRELSITCKVGKLHEINTELEASWCLIQKQLTKALPEGLTNSNLLRYVDICTTLGILTDEKITQYFNSKDLDPLRESLTTERDALRQLLDIQNDEKTEETNTRSGTKGSGFFTRFDRIYSVVMA